MAKLAELISNTNEILYPTTVASQVLTNEVIGERLPQVLDRIDRDIASVTNEVVNARTDNKPNLKARLDDLDGRLAALDITTSGNANEIANIITNLNAFNKEIEQARTDNQNPTHTCNSLNERLDAMQNTTTTINNTVNSVKQEIEQARDGQASLNNRLNNITNATTDAQNLANTANTTANNANAEVESARNDTISNPPINYGTLGERLNANDKKVNYNSHAMFEKHIKHQKSLFTLPTRLTGLKDFPQGFSVNQAKDELYIARQINNGTDVKITKYQLSTLQLIETKQFAKSTGAYQEGLPYFYNGNGELCFLVRTTYDKNLAIFNFDTGVLGANISVLGGSKVASDINNTYLVTSFGSANRFEGFYVYDFDSIVNNNPKLLSTVNVSNIVANGEKTQSIAIIDDKVILGQGELNPVITVVNLDGTILNSIHYNREEFANELATVMPNINPTNYAYENEGVAFYEYNGKLLPMVAHVVDVSTMVFTVIGDESLTAIPSKKNRTKDATSPKWIDVTFEPDVSNYSADVAVQYCKDEDGFVHLRGVCKHTYTSSAPNLVLFELPFPYYPSRNHFFMTVASMSGSNNVPQHNRIEVRRDGKVVLVATTSVSTNPFTALDGISFSVL